MTKSKKITLAAMAAALVGLVGWDIVVAANKQEGDTISEIMLRSSRRVPIVACVWGILTGHLFWPQRKKENDDL